MMLSVMVMSNDEEISRRGPTGRLFFPAIVIRLQLDEQLRLLGELAPRAEHLPCEHVDEAALRERHVARGSIE